MVEVEEVVAEEVAVDAVVVVVEEEVEAMGIIKISNKHQQEEAVVVVVDVEVEAEVIVIVDQQHQKVGQRHPSYKMVKRVLMSIQYPKMNVLSLPRF